MVGQVEKLRQQPRSTLLTEPQALLGSQLLFHERPCSVPESSPRCPVAFSRHTPVWDHFSPRERSGPLVGAGPGAERPECRLWPPRPCPSLYQGLSSCFSPQLPTLSLLLLPAPGGAEETAVSGGCSAPRGFPGPPWLCGGATGLREEQSQGQSHGL